MKLWSKEKKRGKGEAQKGAKRKILCAGSALSATLRERKTMHCARKKQRLCARKIKYLHEKTKILCARTIRINNGEALFRLVAHTEKV